MQHLYTRHSETHSSIRNVFARLRQSVLANSLRTVILLFVLALSCNVWGETIYFTNVALKDGKMVQGMSNAKTQFITQGTNGFEVINNLTISSTPSTASIYYNDADLTNLSVKDKWGSSSSASKYMRGFKWSSGTEYTLSLGTNIASSIIFYGWCGGKKKTLTIGNKSQISAANKQTFEVYNFTDNFTGDIKLKSDGDFYGIIAINLSSCTKPDITTPPVSATYPIGATPTPLQVAATGEGTLTYQWQSSTDNATFANISNATSNTYTPPTDKAGTTYYRCIVSSGSCSTTSASATITIAADNTVYLKPNSNWLQANARFAVYYWDASNTGWADMTRVSECEEVYMAQIPANYTHIIFCRMKPTPTENNWANTWNQTADCEVKNTQLYTIAEGVWDKGNGSWSTYTPVECINRWYVSGNFNNFSLTHPFTNNQVAITLAANTTYEFKIQHQVGNTYSWFGNPSTMTSTNCTDWNFGSLGQDDTNAKITTTIAGAYLFTMSVNPNGTPKLTVTYPTLHTITYQEGRPAEYDRLTTSGIPTSTTQVADGGALTLPDYTTIKITAESGNTTIYEFAGWSDGKTTYPANQTTIDNITSDLTLTATWQPVSFNIYYWDGQNEDNSQNKAINGLTPTTYTYASKDLLPTDAAAITNAAGKQGVVFKNWKVRDWDQTTFTLKDLDYTTPYHLYGDINLYAEWDTFCGEMMRATITGASSATLSGNYAGSAEVKVAKGNATDGYKLGQAGHYVKLTLKNATFQAGDYVVVNVITPSAYLELYADKGNTQWCRKTGVTTGKNILPLPAEAIGKNTVYLYRTSESAMNMNPFITYMSIVRPCCTPLTTFAWNGSSATYTYGESFTAPQLSVQSGILGTILYASSDVSVATIAPDGTLTPQMPGTTTISATYEGDDFCPTMVTYTLNVVCNATAPKIVSDGTETTVGCAQTITLRAVQSTDETDYTTGTFQWYRDREVLSESTASTIEVRVPGNYTVAYNNGVCSVMSTNTAKVTASGSVPEVTRLARYQYFRVSGAYLESQKMRHLFRVKPTATGTPCQITVKAVQNNTETDVTGLANVMDYISFVDNNDGTYDVMLDLNKLQTTGVITGTLSEGDILVFSCAPAACTENTFDDAYAKSIDVRVLGADKKALAFIVSGANGEGSKDKTNHVVGGDFIDGVNKADLYLQTGHNTVDRTKELPLLATLKKTYHVDPVNGYAAFDPINYEPYDLIVFTDFPQASKSTKAAQNLDAIGNMVDVRPMLSLKAHMVRDDLSNGVWKTQKGFTENAVTPDPKKQTVMSILCYAHSMFNDISQANLSDGTTWTQADSTNALTNIMVDKNQNIYIRMLTKGGFEDSKSLQGFTAVASENFINIGTIPDKTHTSLITCCERQANLEARLMLLSINSHATSLLTEVGMKAIERILTYLLVTEPTLVSDCSIVFDNGYNANGIPREGCTKHDGLWNTPENWNTGLTPLPTQNVQIKADVKVVGQATAADVKIQKTKKLTIAPDGALSTNGIIGWLDPKNNATISAITDPTVITVQANETKTGALIQSDKEGKTQATIQMYSRATGLDKGNGMVENAVWQWMTTPYKDVTHAVNTYRGAWLYTYNNSTHSWQQIYDQSPVPPFAGYSITQAQAKTYTMTGTLVPTSDQTISLSNGINLIGNSWTAPINISQFKVEDFANAEATIVMFNTGLDPDGSGAVYTGENSTAQQTYVSIPVNAAIAIDELKVIPAMQAFQVKATAEGATLTLEYDRLVRTKQVGNSPMRAPKHNAQTLGNGINERLRISVIGKRYSDYLYLLSHEEATEGFDNGWDGEKIYSDNLNVPVIYVENAAGDWQISTQPVLAGTQFGFYRGEDDVYTICFDYVGDETLYFYDAVADTYTEVKTGNTYSFISTTDNLERRFALTNFNPYVKPTPTDIDNTDAHSRMVRKFVLNDHVYILIDGVLYDVVGKMVR